MVNIILCAHPLLLNFCVICWSLNFQRTASYYSFLLIEDGQFYVKEGYKNLRWGLYYTSIKYSSESVVSENFTKNILNSPFGIDNIALEKRTTVCSVHLHCLQLCDHALKEILGTMKCLPQEKSYIQPSLALWAPTLKILHEKWSHEKSIGLS